MRFCQRPGCDNPLPSKNKKFCSKACQFGTPSVVSVPAAIAFVQTLGFMGDDLGDTYIDLARLRSERMTDPDLYMRLSRETRLVRTQLITEARNRDVAEEAARLADEESLFERAKSDFNPDIAELG